jgi:hypothetical protein
MERTGRELDTIFAMTPKQKILGAGFATFALLLIPIPYLAAPDWNVWVVDEQGTVLQGMLVRFDYQNYSVENTEHEEDQYTDAQGHAVFHRRSLSASILQRCFYTARSAMAGVHASFGTHAWINVFGQGREGEANDGQYVTDWRGSPDRMESRIVAKLRSDSVQPKDLNGVP